MLEWLKAILGDAHTEEIDKKVSAEIGKAFVARADFNALNEAKKTLDVSVKERDTQLEELRKANPEGLQEQIKALQEANKTAQDKYDNDVKQLKVSTMLETRLLKEGAVNTKAVKALLDQAKITLDGENLIGLDDQLKALKDTEKWAFTAAAGASGKSGSKQGTPGDTGGEATVGSEIMGALYGDAK